MTPMCVRRRVWRLFYLSIYDIGVSLRSDNMLQHKAVHLQTALVWEESGDNRCRGARNKGDGLVGRGGNEVATKKLQLLTSAATLRLSPRRIPPTSPLIFPPAGAF